MPEAQTLPEIANGTQEEMEGRPQRIDTKLNLWTEAVLVSLLPHRLNIFGIIKWTILHCGGTLNRGYYAVYGEPNTDPETLYILSPNNDVYIQWLKPEAHFKIGHPIFGFIKCWFHRPCKSTLGLPRAGVGLGLFESDPIENDDRVNAFH